MKVAVLLSAGVHPISGKRVLPRLEAQAIRMAATLGNALGLHAGPDSDPTEQALGHGLSHAEHRRIATADPTSALVEALTQTAPDVILAGRRGQGGAETGLVPYAVALRLGLTLIPDVVSVLAEGEGGVLIVNQALPKGALRRLTIRAPVLLTVHPSAPPPLPFAYGQARRGRLRSVETGPAAAPLDQPQVQERPYRRRPKVLRTAPAGGSAAERLKAITGEASSDGANVLVRPSPELAAREILAYLRRVGVVAPVVL